MKSVFYILTINKVRYIACIETPTGIVTCTTSRSGFQLIQNGQFARQASTIRELL